MSEASKRRLVEVVPHQVSVVVLHEMPQLAVPDDAAAERLLATRCLGAPPRHFDVRVD